MIIVYISAINALLIVSASLPSMLMCGHVFYTNYSYFPGIILLLVSAILLSINGCVARLSPAATSLGSMLCYTSAMLAVTVAGALSVMGFMCELTAQISEPPPICYQVRPRTCQGPVKFHFDTKKLVTISLLIVLLATMSQYCASIIGCILTCETLHDYDGDDEDDDAGYIIENVGPYRTRASVLKKTAATQLYHNLLMRWVTTLEFFAVICTSVWAISDYSANAPAPKMSRKSQLLVKKLEPKKGKTDCGADGTPRRHSVMTAAASKMSPHDQQHQECLSDNNKPTEHKPLLTAQPPPHKPRRRSSSKPARPLTRAQSHGLQRHPLSQHRLSVTPIVSTTNHSGLTKMTSLDTCVWEQRRTTPVDKRNTVCVASTSMDNRMARKRTPLNMIIANEVV